jgi:arginase
MTAPADDLPAVSGHDGSTLRLLWPQWQGAGVTSVRSLAAEFPFEVARRGYAVGSAVLEAVLPAHAGPTASVPVELGDRGLEKADGIEAKSVVVEQLGAALEVIRRHSPARIVTLGGECSVSVAPFSELAARYGDELACCGSTPTPTSVRRPARIRVTTRWRSPR